MARNYFNNNNKICHHHQQQKLSTSGWEIQRTLKQQKTPKTHKKKMFPKIRESGLRLHLLARNFLAAKAHNHRAKYCYSSRVPKWGQMAFRHAWVTGNSAGIRQKVRQVSHPGL